MRAIYNYILIRPNNSDQVWYITGPKVGIKLSASCAEVNIIWMCSACSVTLCYSPVAEVTNESDLLKKVVVALHRCKNPMQIVRLD